MCFALYICLVKNLVLIIALVMFLRPILPVADYIVNYEYISKVLCENRQKPELQCNGKCQLMKNLAKAAEDEKPISPLKKHQTQETEVLFFEEIMSLIPAKNGAIRYHKMAVRYCNLYSRLTSTSAFHPPSFTT